MFLCLVFQILTLFAQANDEFGSQRQYASQSERDLQPNAIEEVNGELLHRRIDESSNPILAVFHAPWCAPCRSYLRELTRLQQVYNSSLSFVAINAESNSDALAQWGIEWLPATLYLDGKKEVFQEYTGQPKALDLYIWLRRKGRIGIEDVSKDDLSVMSGLSREIGIICGCKSLTTAYLEELRLSLRPLPLVRIASCGDLSLSSKCILKFRLGGGGWREYELDGKGPVSLDELLTKSGRLRLDRQNAELIFRGNNTLLMAIHPPNITDDALTRARRLLDGLEAPDLVITEMGTETPFERRMLDWLGLSYIFDYNADAAISFQLTPLLIALQSPQRFFLTDSLLTKPHDSRRSTIDLSLDSGTHLLFNYTGGSPWFTHSYVEVNNFVKKVQNAEVKPVVAKKELERFRMDGSLVHLNTDGLAMLLDAQEINLVTFLYANWCFHCMKVGSIFKKVAERLSGTEVVFGALNMETNEYPVLRNSGSKQLGVLELDGLPTILIRRKGDLTQVIYDGERSVDGLGNFLIRHFGLKSR